MVPFDMDRLYEPKHPEVVRINPKRQVPVLIHGDLEIFDSTQIFEYLEDLAPAPALWPAGPSSVRAGAPPRTQVRRGLLPAHHPPDGPPAPAGRSCRRRGPTSEHGYYREMDRLLADRDFLAGPYSFADIAFYMAQFFADRMSARSMRKRRDCSDGGTGSPSGRRSAR